ncbi:MAG: type II glyceraldehyde-3-phosphate dehydrogenase [Methanosarcinales archaeon]|nr:type II glyceraldehyde-3-phosphate dehydrogenase [Methanosarcinales archaeon]
MSVKVVVNGYGTIGKRVADAVALQPDMELAGVAKTRPNFEARMALEKGYPLYVLAGRESDFRDAEMEISGTTDDMLEEADVVVDCTPGKIGAQNKPVYDAANIKAIWQGGEAHELAGISFNAHSNYDEALGCDYARVVSCNTTGLSRIISTLDVFGIEKVRATLCRRATDPGDVKKGPINAIVPELKMPSHHGPDVQTVLPHIEIDTVAIKVPTTLMHLHVVNMDLRESCTADDVIDVLDENSRVRLIGEGMSSTAEIMELARDMNRPRSDMWENCVWEESINVSDGELYLFQAIHQESDVIPENVDCIRAMMELESDARRSIKKTNKAMGL